MFTLQFNSLKLMPKGIGNHTGCPLLEDRVHCVAFVFNANSVEQLSYQMVEKIKRIRRELIKSGESLSTLLLRQLIILLGSLGTG